MPYVAQADILDHLRIDPRSLHHLLQHLEDDAIKRGIFEAALCGLAQWRADGQSDDYIIGILLLTVFCQTTGPKRIWGDIAGKSE